MDNIKSHIYAVVNTVSGQVYSLTHGDSAAAASNSAVEKYHAKTGEAIERDDSGRSWTSHKSAAHTMCVERSVFERMLDRKTHSISCGTVDGRMVLPEDFSHAVAAKFATGKERVISASWSDGARVVKYTADLDAHFFFGSWRSYYELRKEGWHPHTLTTAELKNLFLCVGREYHQYEEAGWFAIARESVEQPGELDMYVWKIGQMGCAAYPRKSDSLRCFLFDVNANDAQICATERDRLARALPTVLAESIPNDKAMSMYRLDTILSWISKQSDKEVVIASIKAIVEVGNAKPAVVINEDDEDYGDPYA